MTTPLKIVYLIIKTLNGFQIKSGMTKFINSIITASLLFVLLFSSPTYAAGGSGTTTDLIGNGGGTTTTQSQTAVSPPQATTITPLTTGISSNSTFNQIGNNYGYSGNNSACGIQTYLSGGVSGANNPYAITNTNPGGVTSSTLGSAPNSSYQLQAGITWNQQPCIDQKELLQLQTKAQETQIKIQTQTTQNTTCIQQRGEITKTAISNILPLPTKVQLDEVCKIQGE
jgi:hypothetical protein